MPATRLALESIPDTARPGAADSVAMEQHVFFWLTQLVNLRNQSLSRALPGSGTAARWRVMNTLQQRPGLSMNQLAELTAVDRTTLTRTLDRLEAEALLERRVVPTNRRLLSLRLTPAGRRAFALMLPTVIEQNKLAMKGITVAEGRMLVGVLRRMAHNLGEVADAG